MKLNIIRTLEARATMLLTDESGMSTVEYAIGTAVIYPWAAMACAHNGC